MIITFYSFKGGLGRSMALANVAEILYRMGLRVLMIDWDLEAPGLDQFFETVVNYDIERHPGFIDILTAYKEWSRKPIEEEIELPPTILDCIQTIYPLNEQGASLELISAGQRSGDHFERYMRRVKGFDWKDFYENWEGGRYIEWIRDQMEKRSDVILIDSRTGITAMGNVCVYQLADIVVAFTSASRQSLEGTTRVLEALEAPHVRQLRTDRPLRAMVVPARVEDKAELASYNNFKQEFSKRFDRYCPRRWQEETRQTLWDLKIPYIPLYAFEELVAMRQTGTEHSSDLLEQAFNRIVKAIGYVMPLPRPGPQNILVVEDNKQWRRILNEILAASGYDVQLADTSQSAIDRLQGNSYRLILLNLNLKGGLEQDYEGLDVLRWMKDHGLVIPVVIVTGSPISMSQFKRWPMVQDLIIKGPDIASDQSKAKIRQLLSESMESPLVGSHAL